MSDKPDDTPRIQVDDDWKVEAAREKQKVTEETQDVGTEGPLPPAAFAEIANMIVMQALVSLGGMATPEGQKIPPDLHAAKHHIDLLGVLAEKTKGNLSGEEAKFLETAHYELQMRFVQAVGPAPQGEAPAGS